MSITHLKLSQYRLLRRADELNPDHLEQLNAGAMAHIAKRAKSGLLFYPLIYAAIQLMVPLYSPPIFQLGLLLLLGLLALMRIVQLRRLGRGQLEPRRWNHFVIASQVTAAAWSLGMCTEAIQGGFQPGMILFLTANVGVVLGMLFSYTPNLMLMFSLISLLVLPITFSSIWLGVQGDAGALLAAVLNGLLMAYLAHQTLLLHRDYWNARMDNLQLQLRGEELERARKEAEEASVTKSQFLATMSHEIRTPMNGIMGMTDLALETELKPDQREFLMTVHQSAESLLRIINDILDFSKMEAGKLELDASPFSLRVQLKDILGPLEFRATSKGLGLHSHVGATVPEELIGDSLRIGQILINLCGNAIKFTERGEIRLQVNGAPERERLPQPIRDSRHPLPDTLPEHDYWLYVSVRDNGIGMTPEQTDRIFRSFTQADGSTTRRFGGTGLGLSISSQLAAQMGGEIWVDSEPGQGSVFHVAIQLQTTRKLEAERANRLAGKHTLLLYRNQTSRLHLEELLQEWKMELTVTSRPEDTVDLLARANPPFDYLLVDGLLIKDRAEDLEHALRDLANPPAMVCLHVPGSSTGMGLRGGITRVTQPVERRSLLAALLDARPPLPLTLQAPLVEERNTQRQRILVAEDNEVNQVVARWLLEKLGYVVQMAGNGQVALDMLEEGEFDLVLMDLLMPEMDGLEATRRIRSGRWGADLPIIALTANAMSGDRERCLQAGMDGYLSKPIRRSELVGELERMLGS